MDPIYWFPVVIVAVAGVCFFLVIRWRRRRAPIERKVREDLSIDVAALEPSGLPATGPRLEFYGTPVRVAVFVLAPVGRGGSLPPPDRMPELVENLVPDLMSVLSAHAPVVRRWPEQLSSQGFVHAFFNNLQLPGDRGKGTPWCSIAGKFISGEQLYLAGLVCWAEKPNGLSQVEIQHDGQWADVLRVRRGDA